MASIAIKAQFVDAGNNFIGNVVSVEATLGGTVEDYVFNSSAFGLTVAQLRGAKLVVWGDGADDGSVWKIVEVSAPVVTYTPGGPQNSLSSLAPFRQLGGMRGISATSYPTAVSAA